jgi:hypothetical protein
MRAVPRGSASTAKNVRGRVPFFLIHFFEARYEDGHELHDDRSRDVRRDAEHDDREIGKSAAGETRSGVRGIGCWKKCASWDALMPGIGIAASKAEYDECAQVQKVCASEALVFEDETNFT